MPRHIRCFSTNKIIKCRQGSKSNGLWVSLNYDWQDGWSSEDCYYIPYIANISGQQSHHIITCWWLRKLQSFALGQSTQVKVIVAILLLDQNVKVYPSTTPFGCWGIDQNMVTEFSKICINWRSTIPGTKMKKITNICNYT